MSALFRARGQFVAVVARAKNIAPEVNAVWENQSFHNYADYAMGGGFRSGLARLRELGLVPLCQHSNGLRMCSPRSRSFSP